MYVIMSNGTKIHVSIDAASSTPSYNQEINFKTLLDTIANASTHINARLEAIKILESLGSLAKDALPTLKEVQKQGWHPQLITAASKAITLIDNNVHSAYSPVQNSPHLGFQSQIKNTCATGAHTETKETKTELKNTFKNKKVQRVDIVQSDNLDDVKISRKCNFCEKETIDNPANQKIIEKLCQPDKFFCSFCLRNDHHTKDNRNILMLTFRSIIGYFYYEFYHFPKQPIMYLSEIDNYIQIHKDTGLLNPIFNYDPESYIWFIDFRKIGDSKKKVQITDVYSTIIDILASFNLSLNIKNIQISKLYAKYQESIKDFYEKRYRPEGKKICAPTLKGCGPIDWGTTTYNPNTWTASSPNSNTQNQRFSIEETKNFLPRHLDPTKYWQKMVHS